MMGVEREKGSGPEFCGFAAGDAVELKRGFILEAGCKERYRISMDSLTG